MPNTLIKEFKEKLPEKYQKIPDEEFRKIVRSPWIMTREVIESGSLETIHLKYFGKFLVFEGRAKGLLNSLHKRFKENKITPKEYFRIKEMIEKFLDNGSS